MKKINFIVFCMIFMPLIAMNYSGATTMAGISPSRLDIPFFPYTEQRIDFRTIGYDMADFEFKCPYISAINETVYDEDGVQTFSVYVKLPEKINADPGEYNCGFSMHRPKNINMPAGVSAAAEISALIYIHIPEKGRYAAITLEAPSVNKGEPVFFHVNVRNLGEEYLNSVSARIEVTDINGKLLETLFTESTDVPRFQSKDLWKRMETDRYEPAKYNAKAIVYYAGPADAVAETEFLIGKLHVAYAGMEINATEGKINPVKVNVESWWGNPIENVRAEISMYDNKSELKSGFRTESVDLQPWQKAALQGYWDAGGLVPGDYTAKITLKYKGGETMENVKVILHSQPEETKNGTSFDKIKEVLASPAFLMILVLILVINVGIWMLKRKKEKKGLK